MEELKTKRTNIILITISIIGSIFTAIAIYLIGRNYDFFPSTSDNTYTTTGLNAVYLITTPILTIGIIIITYWAFKAQMLANASIIKDQERRKIEDQFYTMLKLHRENVKELIYRREGHIDVVGKQYFTLIKDDLHYIYNELQHHNVKQKMKLAYEILFNGIKEYKSKNFRINLNDELTCNIDFKFQTYKSQNTEIAVYIRHLYQTVKFIANQDESEGIISYEDKREYLRVLRAQLSTDEQIMLFYNWYADFGSQWEEPNKKDGLDVIENWERNNPNMTKCCTDNLESLKKEFKRQDNIPINNKELLKCPRLGVILLKKSSQETRTGNRFFTDFRMIHNIFPERLLSEVRNELENGSIEELSRKDLRSEKGNDNDDLFELIEINPS
ncbi:putative phage abortive infection protein [Saccharicrinis aurantiacus]|uniref:putative phage abortive infection protein n=1 Tax=Saccharicrinis aurantiacus TaxID=1849719 RepID=UPI00248F6B57|nr:putative phage abortive infection protein [Saccharicrinis aurantiacus]